MLSGLVVGGGNGATAGYVPDEVETLQCVKDLRKLKPFLQQKGIFEACKCVGSANDKRQRRNTYKTRNILNFKA